MTSNDDKLDNSIEIQVYRGRDVITHLEIVLWLFYVREIKYIKERNLPMVHPSFWIFIVIMSQWLLLIVGEKMTVGERNLLRRDANHSEWSPAAGSGSLKSGGVKKVEIDSCALDRFTWVAHFHYSFRRRSEFHSYGG